MNVVENLHDYLKHNDKAELVGFGTFYVKNSSAQINESTLSIEPPKRELFFKKELTDDRGFVKFMASHEFISEDTAYTWIKQYSDSLIEKIQSGRSIVLGKLGTIQKGVLDDYAFTPDKNLNLLDDAFALGILQDVQTFDNEENRVELIHTKPIETTEPLQNSDKTQQVNNEEEEIQRQIEQAEQLKDEHKSQETTEQTEQRKIEHSEAVIDTDVEIPQAETPIDTQLNAQTTPEDKLDETVKRAEEFTDNVVVEDIKPAEKQTTSENTTSEEDALREQAAEIVDKHSKRKIIIKHRKRINRRKRSWIIAFCTILCLLLLCMGYLFAHWLGCFKNVSFLKPIEDKLSTIIPVKNTTPDKVATPIVETPTETIAEETETALEELNEESIPQTPYQGQEIKEKQKTKKAAKTNKNKKQKETTKTTKPAETESDVVDNSPVITQTHSKLGFDVVSGSYADKSKAEAQVRKAKSLGYDGYVLAKIKNGTPIYYVSYGSRRTFKEATTLMQNMINRLGGNYSIISR